MVLEGKNAVVYGGGGKVGGAVARQGSGVILTFSASSVRAYFPGVYVGGSGIACTAIEALKKQLAAEVGLDGIA
jgi:hypothetical protein